MKGILQMKFYNLNRPVYLLWNKRVKQDDGMFVYECYINTHKINYPLFERYRKLFSMYDSYKLVEITTSKTLRTEPNKTEQEINKTIHTYWRTI